MEYGGTVLQKRLHKDPDKGNTRRTSDVFELATAIAFQSSGQNFALTPRNLTEQPQFEIDFMKKVPTTWDETRFIDGYPGKYVVLARKATNGQWYIAGLNALNEPLTLTIDLSSLTSYLSPLTSLYLDNKKGEPTLTPLKLDKKQQVKVTIQPRGGLIIK